MLYTSRHVRKKIDFFKVKVNVFRAYWKTDKKSQEKTGRNEKNLPAIGAIDPDNYTDFIFQV